MFKPKSLRHPSKDIQETSTTIVSQPAANKTSPLKQPHPRDNLDESMNTSRKKKVQTSLKSENKICWRFYVFFDLVVISSVLFLSVLFLPFYCSIVDLIERIYFQKYLVKQKKKTKTKKNKKKTKKMKYRGTTF